MKIVVMKLRDEDFELITNGVSVPAMFVIDERVIEDEQWEPIHEALKKIKEI